MLSLYWRAVEGSHTLGTDAGPTDSRPCTRLNSRLKNGSEIASPIDGERAAERHERRFHAERGNEDSGPHSVQATAWGVIAVQIPSPRFGARC